MFSDEQIKRLREYVQYPLGIGTGCLDPTCVFTNADIRALLARLDAAEKVCGVADIISGTPKGKTFPYLGDLVKKWLKEAGKGDV